MSGAGERFEREFEVAGRRHRATAAWRGPETGYGVLYVFSRDEAQDGPVGADRGDRRALLTPEVDLETLTESGLLALYETGRPLTETERRFAAADGRQWLAQSQGPVWAGRAGAEGGTGVLFTSLEGEAVSLQAPGGHVGEMTEQELVALWSRASQSRMADEAGPAPDASDERSRTAADEPA